MDMKFVPSNMVLFKPSRELTYPIFGKRKLIFKSDLGGDLAQFQGG